MHSTLLFRFGRTHGAKNLIKTDFPVVISWKLFWWSWTTSPATRGIESAKYKANFVMVMVVLVMWPLSFGKDGIRKASSSQPKPLTARNAFNGWCTNRQWFAIFSDSQLCINAGQTNNPIYIFKNNRRGIPRYLERNVTLGAPWTYISTFLPVIFYPWVLPCFQI